MKQLFNDIFRKIEGFLHIDLDGNCVYFGEDTPTDYIRVIGTALEKQETMRKVALEKGVDTFSYNKIAQRSIMGGK